MTIQTSRFGPLDMDADRILEFPHGLYGFEDRHRFCLLQHDQQSCFRWLQCIDDPSLAMVVVDLLAFFPDYDLEIGRQTARLLEAQSENELELLALVTVNRDTEQICANLLGPVVINPRRRKGLQMIADGERYHTRHEIGAPRRQTRAPDIAAAV
ncbi:MAG: flagellar assembly protein FliW [Armatimonadetes bacterium]|nr:flagellar assembly protein FliW [Armatimonadota bacterium]